MRNSHWPTKIAIMAALLVSSICRLGVVDFPTCSASMLEDEGDSLRVDEGSEPNEIIKAQKNVTRVDVYCTNVDFLSDPKIFRRLSDVNLSASQNSPSLLVLAKSHPQIEYLAISQTGPLSTCAASSLKSFSNLQILELDCPIEGQAHVFLKLPKNLRILHLKQAVQFDELPNLVNLIFAGCPINNAVMQEIRAPRLELLDVQGASVGEDIIPSLSKFLKLNAIFLPATFQNFRKEVEQQTKANLFITGQPYPSFEKHPDLLGPLR